VIPDDKIVPESPAKLAERAIDKALAPKKNCCGSRMKEAVN
jgi:hypothetical protein